MKYIDKSMEKYVIPLLRAEQQDCCVTCHGSFEGSPDIHLKLKKGFKGDLKALGFNLTIHDLELVHNKIECDTPRPPLFGGDDHP